MIPQYQSNTYVYGSSSSSVTIGRPSGLQVGDLLLFSLFGESDFNPTVSGYTLIDSTTNSQSKKLSIYTKTADSSDVSNATYTFSSGVSRNWSASMIRISGFNTSVTIADKSKSNIENSSTLTLSSLTPLHKNSLFLIISANDSQRTFSGYAMATDNPTWTEAFENNGIWGGNPVVYHAMAYSTLRPQISASGNITATLSSSGYGAGFALIINSTPTEQTISETVTISETYTKKISRIFTDTIVVVESLSQLISRLWNKVTKPTTTWTNKPKN